MKTSFIAAAMLAISAVGAHAETNSLSGKAMSDLPGTKGGFTVNPTSKFFSGSLSDQVQMNLSAVHSGRTDNPLARPDDYSLSTWGARTLTQ